MRPYNEELLELLRELRAIGIKSVRIAPDRGEWACQDVEFFEPLPAIEAGAILPKAMTQNAPYQEDTCPCGHQEHAHSGGLCLLGCEVAKCARALDVVKAE